MGRADVDETVDTKAVDAVVSGVVTMKAVAENWRLEGSQGSPNLG